MVTEFEPAAGQAQHKFFPVRLPCDWLSAYTERMLRSPGIYSLVSGVFAVFVVFSPGAAPGWFLLLCLVFSFLALLRTLWATAALAMTLRRYRAESISFDHAVRSLSWAARGLFQAGQLVAVALALGLAAGLALAFPGLAILASFLTPALAVALAALWGATVVPRYSDAGLTLVVPPRTLPSGEDSEDRFYIAWRFAARMAAVRAAVADRQGLLPPEARDMAKALDGGGTIRPPVNRLSLDPVGVLLLRGRGLAAVLSAALPIAMVAWILAAMMPPGALPALPRPADLWTFAASEDPPIPDAPSGPRDEPAKGPPGQDSSERSPDGSSGDAGGDQEGGANADGSGGRQVAEPGFDGAGQAGGRQPGRASDDDSGDGQRADPGGDGAGQAGGGQPGGASADGLRGGLGAASASDGAGKADGRQPEGASADGSGGGGGADLRSDGTGQSGGDQQGGASRDVSGGGLGADSASDDAGQAGGDHAGEVSADGSAQGGFAAGAATGGDGGSGPAGGTDTSLQIGSGSEDRLADGDIADYDDTAESSLITRDGSGGDHGKAIIPASGEGADEQWSLPSAPAAEGSEALEVGTPPSLFAPPGSAPPAVLQDLSPEATTEMPPGPAIPPRQRLPAWIADLYR